MFSKYKWPKVKLLSLIFFLISVFFTNCMPSRVYDSDSNELSEGFDQKYQELLKINKLLAFIDYYKSNKMNSKNQIDSEQAHKVTKQRPVIVEQKITKKFKNDFLQ